MDKVKCPRSFPRWNYSLATVSLPLTLLDLEQQLGMFSHRFQNQVFAFSKDLLLVKESMVEVKPKHQCNHTHLQHICITQQPGQVHDSLSPSATFQNHCNFHIQLSKKRTRSPHELNTNKLKAPLFGCCCHLFLPSHSSALYLGSVS